VLIAAHPVHLHTVGQGTFQLFLQTGAKYHIQFLLGYAFGGMGYFKTVDLPD